VASADSLPYVAALDEYQRQAEARLEALKSGSGDDRGTPLDWAIYGGRSRIADYLRNPAASRIQANL
jgi:hypothetical protein